MLASWTTNSHIWSGSWTQTAQSYTPRVFYNYDIVVHGNGSGGGTWDLTISGGDLASPIVNTGLTLRSDYVFYLDGFRLQSNRSGGDFPDGALYIDDVYIIAEEIPEIGINWAASWLKVNVMDVNMHQLAIAAKDGKLGLTYTKSTIVGQDALHLYSEYTYSGSTLAPGILDESVPGTIGYWGTYIRGIAFDSNGHAMIGAIGPLGNPTMDALVLERFSAGIYNSEKASDVNTLPAGNIGGQWENFGLDGNDKKHFVWSDSIVNKIFYAKKTGSSWNRSFMSTSGWSYPRPAMTLDASNNPHFAYLDTYGGTQGTYYTSDLVSSSFVGIGSCGDPGTRQEIEMQANGYPMIAHMDPSISSIVLELYNGSSWDRTTIVSSIDPRAYGWYGIGAYLDLEVDANGNPVVVLAHLDNYDLGTSAKLIIDYYARIPSGQWIHETIGTFNSGGIFAQGLDLVFDEAGRPFVGVVINDTPGGSRNVYLLSADFSNEATVCGDIYTQYLDYDFNHDCYVNFKDMDVLAGQWLDCTNPGGAGCEAPSTVPPPYEIYPGTATVDGDLSEWDDVAWIAMDQVLYNTPTDLTNAKWAAKWDDTANRIYVAVTAADSYHYFNTTPAGWDQQDAVELFVDAANWDTSSYDLFGYEDAQQWTVGPTRGASSGIWGGSRWAYLAYDLDMPAGTALESAANVSGNVISYEFSIRPYSAFYYYSQGSSVEVDLEPNAVVGLDVVIGTRTDSGGTFGMLCENLDGGKASYAGQFRDYTLKGSGICGSWGYVTGDVDQNCKVDFADFAKFAEQWMQCTDPAVAYCDQFWTP